MNYQKLPNFETASTLIVSKNMVNRKEKLLSKIKGILEEASGNHNIAAGNTFFEAGLDSLLLTQVVLTFKREFGLPLTFRQLNEELETPELLARYLDENMPGNLHPAASNSISNSKDEAKTPASVIFTHPPVPGAKLGRDKEDTRMVYS